MEMVAKGLICGRKRSYPLLWRCVAAGRRGDVMVEEVKQRSSVVAGCYCGGEGFGELEKIGRLG
jgi:hypothetical protein